MQRNLEERKLRNMCSVKLQKHFQRSLGKVHSSIFKEDKRTLIQNRKAKVFIVDILYSILYPFFRYGTFPIIARLVPIVDVLEMRTFSSHNSILQCILKRQEEKITAIQCYGYHIFWMAMQERKPICFT